MERSGIVANLRGKALKIGIVITYLLYFTLSVIRAIHRMCFINQLLFLPDTCNSTTPVRHGSTVAFQAYIKHDWLGCSTTTTSCSKSACPSLYMEGNDWNTCRENVFQIFRAYGHGDVAVGDLVGLYLTRESGKWFDCSQTSCRKSNCPGTANYEHGFDTHEIQSMVCCTCTLDLTRFLLFALLIMASTLFHRNFPSRHN